MGAGRLRLGAAAGCPRDNKPCNTACLDEYGTNSRHAGTGRRRPSAPAAAVLGVGAARFRTPSSPTHGGYARP